MEKQQTESRPALSHQFGLKLLALGVFGNGVLLVFHSLANQIVLHRHLFRSTVRINIGLIAGLSLVYLSTLLSRRKQTAWLVVIAIYVLVIGVNIITGLFILFHGKTSDMDVLLRAIALPVIIVVGLFYYRQEYNVKSDTRNITVSFRFVALILTIALLYGVIGFQLMDKRDFHQEMTLLQAVRYTIDQFYLTTKELVPYTPRARAFLDSLSLVSLISIGYALVSLFQPIRSLLVDETENRAKLERLLQQSGGSSEDFFKLWPHDKSYYFSRDGQAGLAYHTYRGVALCVGDPIGPSKSVQTLFGDFIQYCQINDWLPAFIHTELKAQTLYKQYGFSTQKIGEEAIVDLWSFCDNVARTKYFRNITNRFDKQGYHVEMLQPPHNPAILNRLEEISKNWLELPGRSERGFMLGYFRRDYIQLCPIMVVRDEASTIQAFINKIPSYDGSEANYDLLRHHTNAAANINDFLLVNFAKYLLQAGYARLNLGLCPLAGLNDVDNEKSAINTTLKFVYANGDRFYSFTGLWRFKAKYEPKWQDRYIAYKGGVRGFTRTLRALNTTMNKSAKQNLVRKDRG